MSLLGTTPDETSLDGPCSAPATDPASVKVNAVVDFFGPSDLRKSSDQPAGLLPFVSALLGGAPESVPERAALASPLAQVTNSAPPFLILHGSADPLVPKEHSERLHATLQGAGVPSTLIVVPDGGHGFGAGPFAAFPTEPEYQSVTCTVLRFLRERLRP